MKFSVFNFFVPTGFPIDKIELFESNDNLDKINKRLTQLTAKIIDLKAQIMGNYKFQCTETESAEIIEEEDMRTTPAITDTDEINNLLDGLSQTAVDEPLPTQKQITQTQITRKQLKYAKITRDINGKKPDDLEDIDFMATNVPEHIKLGRHLKCYNTSKYKYLLNK